MACSVWQGRAPLQYGLMTGTVGSGGSGLQVSTARRWTCSDEIAASLTYYPSAGRQARHVHDHSQISFLLGGSLTEQLEGREHRPCAQAVGYKPVGAAHADAWGADGALLFTLKISGAGASNLPRGREPGWASLPDAPWVARLVGAFVDASHAEQREEVAFDLLSLNGESSGARGAPPAWLARMRDRMQECPDDTSFMEAAREAGVHRVQLSRAFRRFYGIPPSVFRRRLLVARGLSLLARRDLPLSTAALDAGFCDQAHFTRRLREQTGLTPARLRSLLARATSVQSETSGTG